ncbi:ribonuclease D [Candidatus Cytomitobacter primus]|uniref:Ribonuclease D n=1 Tax=Candidatus Cytomitobacter primus TaxID=2066024 RepID=A0A5C0UFE4_9PROT|nr:ribonuclease D [Candidatus Cytomitobacter primus]
MLHENDLPDDIEISDSVAIDTETTGLHLYRDRLCLVQLTFNDGICHLVQIDKDQKEAKNLTAILENENIEKIFHFGRFDMAILYQAFKVMPRPIYCTKLASKLIRTYTERHGLRELCRELLGVEISKDKQSSDWGSAELQDDQKNYAAKDVIFLHKLQDKLTAMLLREGRHDLAVSCFDFLENRVKLDCAGWHDVDIFAHL